MKKLIYFPFEARIKTSSTQDTPPVQLPSIHPPTKAHIKPRQRGRGGAVGGAAFRTSSGGREIEKGEGRKWSEWRTRAL